MYVVGLRLIFYLIYLGCNTIPLPISVKCSKIFVSYLTLNQKWEWSVLKDLREPYALETKKTMGKKQGCCKGVIFFIHKL